MNIQQQFEEMCLNHNITPLFEIPVKNRQTGEHDFIIFNVSIRDGQFIAVHEALTQAEEESDKIAYKAIDIDEGFSLNENIQELYAECIDAIINSDFFELTD
jgi:hypothetical protein